jgi:outer membrane protein OmpA-like peptidoglycan-associated protein
MHSADFQTLPGIESCCPRYETGSGIGYNIGLMYAFPLSVDWELAFRVGLYDLSAKLTKTEDVWLAGPDGFGVNGQFEHSVDAKLSSIGLSPIVAWKLSKQLRLHGGLRIGYLMTKTMSSKEEIVSPSYGVFPLENSRVRNVYTDIDIPDASSIEAAVLLGASYDFALNSVNTLFLSPEVFFSYGVTNISNSESWKSNFLSGGLAIKYSPREVIPPKPPTPPPPPPPLPPPPPPPVTPVLDANILAVGIDDMGRENNVSILKVEEFLSNRMHPILNYIFFDENTAELGSRYVKLNQSQKNSFNLKQLYNLKTLDVYHQLLNIIGKRLESYPQASITLLGCNSDENAEKANETLSKNRADNVKNYLVDVWGIDPARIEVKSRNLPEIPSNPSTVEGVQENRRVEVLANIPQVFEPLIIRDTLREANPPFIRFKTKINTPIGVKSWNVVTSQNNKNLRIFSGAGKLPDKIDWDIKREDEQAYIPRFTEPLNYKLQVVDNDNKLWESEVQTLPVEQLTVEKKMMELIEDKEIDRFSLILFNFGQAELSKENESIAGFAKNRIRKSSTVTIKGYSDMLGENDYNLKLSQRRADATAKALGVDLRFAKGFGEEVLLYDNNLPEGRFYCRTVNIEIVTPIE